MAVSADQPISAGNLKALIPKIIAESGAFSQGYWNGEIKYNNSFETVPGTRQLSQITGTGGRIITSGSTLYVIDAGTYHISATIDAPLADSVDVSNNNITFTTRATAGESSQVISEITCGPRQLDGQIVNADITVAAGANLSFSMQITNRQGYARLSYFSLASFQIIRIE